MKLLKNLIKPLMGLVVLWLLFKGGGLNLSLLRKAFSEHSVLILVGFITYFLLTVVAGVRWFMLLRAAGINHSFRSVFSFHMIGLFFVTLIPGGTGGDLIKGYYLYRDTPSRKGAALTSIVMDRLVGMYTLVIWGMLGMLLNYKMAFAHPALRYNAIFYLSVFIVGTGGVIFFFTPWANRLLCHPGVDKLPGGKAIKGLFEAIQHYQRKPFILLSASLMTLLVHGGILLVCFTAALSLDVPLSFREHTFAVPVLTIINGLPISPGGIGVGEAAAEYLYGLMKCSKGGEIYIIYHIFVLMVALIGLPFYLFYKKSSSSSRAKSRGSRFKIPD